MTCWRRCRAALAKTLPPPPPPPKSKAPIIIGVVVVALLAVVAAVFWRMQERKAEDAREQQAAKTAQVHVDTAVATASKRPQGVTDTEITFGMSAPFSGPAKELGRAMKIGIDIAFSAVNDQGGVNGRKLKLIALDDGYEPARTVPNTKKLIEQDKVFALVGYVGTPTSVPAIPVFTEAKVPFVGPFTGAESLRTPFNRYIFHVRASYYDETDKIVEQVVSIGGKNIAVFYQNDAYGQAGLKGVELAMTKRKDRKSVV